MEDQKKQMLSMVLNTPTYMEAQMIRGLASTALIIFIVLPTAAPAQDRPATENAEITPDDADDQSTGMTDVDRKIAEMEKEIDALKAESKKNKEETENIKFELESLDQQGNEDLNTTVPFTVYGFFDLSYLHLITADNTTSSLVIPNVPTFLVSSVNLYFLSQMTESLSAILELRFSFLPHGQDTGYETVVYFRDTEVAQEGEYTRTSTRVTDPFSTQVFVQGGLTIERVHLTYSPFDWLQVIAGRFLTPYGIWNIDHGSPVVLPVRLPYMQVRQMVPLAQTGLQIFGRVYPTDKLALDYAITVSNGRGPMEQVYDLDKNKGLGVRLRLNYSGDKLFFALGGYGYYGTSTDKKKVITMQMTRDMTLDEENYDRPMKVEHETVDEYDEYVVSADFLIEFYRIRLQSEYIWRYVDYNKSGMIAFSEVALKSGSPFEEYYWGSYIGNDVYVLTSYELPLDQWISPVRITPYFMYEYGDPIDMMPQISFQTFNFGLNVKPSPYVALKAEYSYAIPKSTIAYGNNLQNFAAQVAVSF